MLSNGQKTLLLGAGFSYDLGMPLASELTEVFLRPFNWWSTRSLARTLATKDPYSKGRPINFVAIERALKLVLERKKQGCTNYEALLAEIEALHHAPGTEQTDRDSYHFVFGFLYDLIYGILYAYQLDAYTNLYTRNHRHFGKLGDLLCSEQPTWIFSLNHDLFVECLAIDQGIPITYGDSSTITFPRSNLHSHDTLELTYSEPSDFATNGPGWLRKGNGINLVRLHGGLAEHAYKDRAIICNPSLAHASSSELISELQRIESMAYYNRGLRVPSGRDRVITGPDGTLDILRRTMLTGGHKYTKTTKPKKGEEKLQLLEQVLKETDELTVIGYSFGDGHVNHRISNAMVLNSKLRLRSVDPKGKRCPAFLEQFDYDQRVGAAYCGAAQWMSYVLEEKWDKEQTEELRRSEPVRKDIQKRVAADWWKLRFAGMRPA